MSFCKFEINPSYAIYIDPDHGYFAHSSSGSMALAFDWYASDGVNNTIDIHEDFTPTGSWKITSAVNAVDKLIRYNKEVRLSQVNGKAKDDTKRGLLVNKPRKNDKPKLATTTFMAPSVITLARRDNINATSQFITAFWICPVGTGKSRFMSAAISKTPIAIPRWLVHMNLNNFLDQDTYLLVGQNRAVLQREAEGYRLAEATTKDGSCNIEGNSVNNARQSTYVYKSPSERMGVRIGKFFDATLSRVPNRKEALLSWYHRNSNNNVLFEEWPSREVVLDRYKQHTAICQNSMDVVRNCDAIMRRSKIVSAALILIKVMHNKFSLLQAAVQESTMLSISSIDAFKQSVALLAGKIVTLKAVRVLLTNKLLFAILGLAGKFVLCQHLVIHPSIHELIITFPATQYWIASRIRRESFVKFNDVLHRRDIKYITQNWADL